MVHIIYVHKSQGGKGKKGESLRRVSRVAKARASVDKSQGGKGKKGENLGKD